MKWREQMSRLKLLLIAGALISGCAAAPSPNPWDSVEVKHEPAQRAVEAPRFPLPVEITEEWATFDVAGIRALDLNRQAARANAKNVNAHADQIDALRDAAEHLVEAGRAQRQVADMRAEILLEERRQMMFERFGLWAIALLAVLTGL